MSAGEAEVASGFSRKISMNGSRWSFARETRRVTAFAVYDPTDDTGFVRVIGAISLHDNVWLEGSLGIVAGSSLDTFGRLTRRDFFYARLKVFY